MCTWRLVGSSIGGGSLGPGRLGDRGMDRQGSLGLGGRDMGTGKDSGEDPVPMESLQ